MEGLFRNTGLYSDIQNRVLDFLTESSEEKYWQNIYKEIFSTRVLSKLIPKSYFTQYVLPEIDRGLILVGINTYIFCDFCLINREIHPDCCNCNIRIPCSNCYFYGTCNQCSEEFEIISWKRMRDFLSDLKIYKNYIEFRLNSISN